MQEIYQKSSPMKYHCVIYGALGFPARTFLQRASEKGLPEEEAVYFLKLLDFSKDEVQMIDPTGLSLKTLEISYQLMMDGTLPRFCLKFPNSATISSMESSIQKISGYHKAEGAYLLSATDILEVKTSEEFFLSPTQTEMILRELYRPVKKKESNQIKFSDIQNLTTQSPNS